MTDLLAASPRWVQLLDDEQGLTVLELDEGAVDGAPWAGFGVQLTVSVDLQDPDEQGQPYAEEHEVLAAFRRVLEQALNGHGRVVATITMDGVREHVAYVRSDDVVAAWRDAPPAGFGTHDAQVQLLEDPRWLGLREIAGLLGEQEEPLRPPLD